MYTYFISHFLKTKMKEALNSERKASCSFMLQISYTTKTYVIFTRIKPLTKKTISNILAAKVLACMKKLL